MVKISGLVVSVNVMKMAGYDCGQCCKNDGFSGFVRLHEKDGLSDKSMW